ncbi:hypothetical protein I3843_09G012100 [Carya illinoinensis]|nr:hypothetical protein I3843_09G012100 [Carya illinoinensis]
MKVFHAEDSLKVVGNPLLSLHGIRAFTGPKRNRCKGIATVADSVDGLPSGTEITADIPRSLVSLLFTAFDLTEPTIESSLGDIRPHFVFYDLAHWLPSLARRLRIKAICLSVVGPPAVGYLISPERKLIEKHLTEVNLKAPPPSFPPSSIKLSAHESREALTLVTVKKDGQGGISFVERLMISYTDCDALVFKACREMEGIYCHYLEAQIRKPVILSGPMVPGPPTSALEKKWATWMDGFEAKTVILCAFGSECILKKAEPLWSVDRCAHSGYSVSVIENDAVVRVEGGENAFPDRLVGAEAMGKDQELLSRPFHTEVEGFYCAVAHEV